MSRVRVVESLECKFNLYSVANRDPGKGFWQESKPTRAVFSGDGFACLQKRVKEEEIRA